MGQQDHDDNMSAAQKSDSILAGGGEMGRRLRAFDWGKSPLGLPANWPRSLVTAVRIMLTSRQPIWIGWGKQLIYLYNDAYKSIIGGKHPAALGEPTHMIWREIWAEIEPMLDTALKGVEGTYVESQLLIMERNGYPEETYYTFSYSPIPDDDGTPNGIICANTDDTQRVIGERQLALLRDVAASSSDARTWQEVCERSARALRSNPYDLPFAMIYIAEPDGATLRLAGATGIQPGHAAAPVEMPIPNAKPWAIDEVLKSHILVVVDDLSSRFNGSLPTGAWKVPPGKAALLPITSAGETGRGGVLVVGLNPYRLFDEGYRNFLTLAAGQIAASIANAQAYEDERKRAESLAELDRAKTTFFSNVSHEFRTPLTLMLGPLQDAIAQANNVLPKEAVEELSLVHRNGLRLLKLVNTLLDFSRIEAGRVDAVYEPTDLAKFTADLASVFRSAVEKAGMKLIVDCPRLSQDAYVDRSMWEKIVLNLLSNAFKFTLEGQISVSLRAVDGMAVLTVADSGSGIPDDEIPRLFERFHRVEGTKGRTHEGTGIGLALVQELARLHGGTVTVKSRLGDGSAFTVRIPLGSAHLPANRINASSTLIPTALGRQVFVEEAERWTPSDDHEPIEYVPPDTLAPAQRDATGHRLRVLLADDNADMRQYVRRLLAGQYEVEAVNDGQAALQSIRKRRPDLVVSDVMMPNLDGFGLLKELRGNADTATIPLILLSARAGEEATLEGLQAGADDYLVKPFSAREFLGRVSALLERKRFQNELALADERLRMALNAAHMAAWEWDIVTDNVVASDTMAEVFGLRAGQSLNAGKDGFQLLHSDDAPQHRAQLQKAINSLSGFHSQFRVIRPADGEIAWMEERGTARKDPVTGHIKLIGVVMDITAAKRAEAEREMLLDRERAARNDAERASQLKEEFLTTLSHELRTPLNAILGWAQILERGSRDPETLSEGLSVISRNARAQTQLIEDLLDMSRIAAGKLRLDVQRVDLAEIVSEAIESVRPAAEARQIRVTKVLDSPNPIVSGDPHRLQQVVWNLLSNAIKFTPKGGRVQVVLERVNSQMSLSVIDNGQGIAPDFLPHVFERFRQADASTKRSFGGLGLGLAIVKQLVELHGGTVRARSDGDGLGSTFIVTLPLANLDERRSRQTSPANDGADGHTSVSLDGVKVLVVDDEPDARALVERILRECNALVVTAASAEEAFELFHRDRPDVIVSDIGMPDQDGYEFLRRIRRLKPAEGGQTPAAALTAYARAQDRRQALVAGYQSHVVKPAEPAELVTVVASLAGKFG